MELVWEVVLVNPKGKRFVLKDVAFGYSVEHMKSVVECEVIKFCMERNYTAERLTFSKEMYMN